MDEEIEFKKLGSKLFDCGRYKGKSYESVFREDRDYCFLALSQFEPTRYIPEDFKYFLLSKIAKIKTESVSDFEKLLPSIAVKYFRKIIDVGRPNIITRKVHESCDASRVQSNGFKGVFYRNIFKKFVANAKHIDCKFLIAEEFGSFFPFKVSSSVERAENLRIFQLLDEEFYAEMDRFLDTYFGKGITASNSTDTYKLLLWNVSHFERNCVSEDEVLRGFSMATVDSASEHDHDHPYFNDLTTFCRIGIKWYEKVYEMYNDLQDEFGKPPEARLTFNYDEVAVLPEINLLELYSLLDADFFTTSREEYVKMAQKYLFFFIRAVRLPTHPVNFIDEVLYECLKSLNKVEKYEDGAADEQEFLYDIAMVSLVHRRLHPIKDHLYEKCDIRDAHLLEDIKNYVSKIPDIEDAQLDYYVKDEVLGGIVTLCCGDTCYEVSFSRTHKCFIRNFYNRIFCSAFMKVEKPIHSIVIYNAFVGEESKITIPIDRMEHVRKFVRACNHFRRNPDPLKAQQESYSYLLGYRLIQKNQ